MVLSHLLPLSLLVVPIAWGLYGYLKTRKEAKLSFEKASSPWPLIINSSVLYALAFNLIFFIQELFLALGKKWLGLKAYLYHNNHSWEGHHPMQDLAQGYGATAIFITGVICLLIARRIKLSAHWLQLFFLWMAFQGLAQSLPQFITASMAPDTDTGQAYTYLGITDKVGTLITIAGIILMLLTGMAYSQYLLQLAPSDKHITNASHRFNYLFRVAVAAAVIGIMLIIPFRIMPWSRATAPVFVTLLSIPMVFANAWKVKAGYTINSKVNRKVFVWPVILLLILLFIFQLILAKGVEV
ncbi:MAG: hypothetical protein WDO16_18315, partial [Bacteroidota bacterium]